MNAQTKMLLAAIAGGVAVGFGGASVLGVPGPAASAPAGEPALAEQLRSAEADRDAFQDAVFETQERLAAISRELEETRAELDGLRAERALAAAEAAMDDDAFWEAEMEAALSQTPAPEVDARAELPGAQAAPEGRDPRWDPERIAAMRAERNDRVRGFFDEAIDRAPTRESQERIAAIEAYTQDAMELMRAWRGADEAEREVLREQMGAMRSSMRDLIREEEDARVRAAAARHGIDDASQQQALADAIREAQSDPIFRGGQWTGRRGGGPAPMWGGGRGGGSSSR